MDEKLINELIEQLEQNLKNVESARLQVEKTVQAYDVLRTDVGKYTSELSFIAQNARTMISQLEEIKEKFLGNISVKIVEEINAAVKTINGEIDGVSSQTNALHDLADKGFKQVNNNVKQRADNIDSTLSTVQAELNAIDAKIMSCSNQLGQLVTLLNSLKGDEKSHYESLVKQMEEQKCYLYSELTAVKKQIILFSVIIIVLLLLIGGIVLFNNHTQYA